MSRYVCFHCTNEVIENHYGIYPSKHNGEECQKVICEDCLKELDQTPKDLYFPMVVYYPVKNPTFYGVIEA